MQSIIKNEYSISLGSLVNGEPLNMIENTLIKDRLKIIQLCPQNKCIINERLISTIRSKKPESEIRLHANVSLMDISEFKKQSSFPMCHVDASTYNHREFDFYWKRLMSILSFNGNPYTIHAGTRSGSTLSRMISNIKELEQRSGVKVGVEGMYPTKPYLNNSGGFLMASLNEYKKVMYSGIHYAIDLSHLNIVKHKMPEYFDIGLVKDLVSCDNCIEVHVSSNNGNADTHDKITNKEWWFDVLDLISCPIISEERIENCQFNSI